ncbi:MAG: hypothetical protein KL839_01160 [Rhizobium sp.]|nr:hypothetical protein [Rhizobium sp.]
MPKASCSLKEAWKRGESKSRPKHQAQQADLEKQLRSEASMEAAKQFQDARTKLENEAEMRGFERGVTQTRLEYQDIENQTKILAGLMTIIQSPSVQQALPSTTNEKIATVSRNIETGDLKSAVDALPRGLDLAVRDNCLNLSSGDFIFYQQSNL